MADYILFVLIIRNSDYHRHKVNKDVKSWSYTQAKFLYFTLHWEVTQGHFFFENISLKGTYELLAIIYDQWLARRKSHLANEKWWWNLDDHQSCVNGHHDVKIRCPSGIFYIYLIEVEWSVFEIIMAHSTPI